MALSSARLAAAILARLLPLWREEPPDSSVQDEDYFLTQLATILAEETISEITTNARGSGTDSNGDSHDNVQIV